MIYKCLDCEFREGRGVLPGVSCGILMLLEMGVATLLISFVARALLPDDLGWWWLLIAPVLFVLALPAGYLVAVALAALEWLVFSLRRCPRCGARRWSFGFTEGFGL